MPTLLRFIRSFFLLSFLCGSFTAMGEGLKILRGHIPAIISNLKPRSRLTATNEMRLAIGLPLRNTAQLEKLLADLYDPSNPNYRHFLSYAQFTAAFGPTEEDYETVKKFARTNGLTIALSHGNRLVLDVEGPASSVEKAFHVSLQTYAHPTEARDFFAPDREPTVDAQLPVIDIQGLSDFSRPHPKIVMRDRVSAPYKNGSAPDGSGGYFGDDFRNAYAPGVTLEGAGQSVGLFEADGFYVNDIAAYARAAGGARTNIIIQKVLLDGFRGHPGGANVEVSLDIEMVMDMAPGLSKIVVYEGNQNNYMPNDILEAMAADAATVKNLSSSWGWGGGPSTTTDNIFNNMAATGQSFFNASGDSCAFTGGPNSANGVDDPSSPGAPSSSPYITQVGGTTLTVNGAGGSYSSETVWNWGIELGPSFDGHGSSGGVSSFYPIPSWQLSVDNMSARGGSTAFRNIPDVALTADNIYVISGGHAVGSSSIGGTSCAAPLWAGFMALVNERAAANGSPSVGFINPAIYAIAATPGYSACFNDIATGNNTWSGSPDAFYATTGYDLCTGLGSPAGEGLIDALGGAVPSVSPPSIAASGVGGGPFNFTPKNFVLSNPTTSPLAWSLVGASAWLALQPASGTVPAGTQAIINCGLTSAASNLMVGTYTANLIFSNSASQAGIPAIFSLQVNQPMSVSPTNQLTLSGLPGGPFSMVSQNYTLSNQSAGALSWSLTNMPAWLAAVPAYGILPAGGQAPVTIGLGPTASNLATGSYSATVFVTNFFGLASSLPITLNLDSSLVANGSFETGNFSSWTLNGSQYNSVSPTRDFIHSGNYGAALGQSGVLGFLSQILPTIKGQNYLLSFWLQNPTNAAGSSPNQVLVQWEGATVFSETNIPFSAWTNLQVIVTADGPSATLQFGFEDTPAYLGLDDISLIPVALPQFLSAQLNPGGLNLTWTITSNFVYQVQYTTNLTPPNWLDLGAPITATTNLLTFTDNALTVSPSKFYRLKQLP